MPQYNNIQWVVQSNLTSENVLDDIKRACEKISVDCHALQVIPFSEELPYFPKDKRSIFYGSTTTMYLVHTDSSISEGLFFSPNEFTMENYFHKWGENMLNYGANIVKVKDINTLNWDKNKQLFIRPNEDSKSFNGEVKPFGEIAHWLQSIQLSQDLTLNEDTQILIGEPYHIEAEWRLWIVNKKVITASKYRENFKLKKETGCPSEVIEFAEKRCQEYTPHRFFVMDIGLCGNQLYIIECGCLNSAGFYAADIEKIVYTVSEVF